jgi:hypothetical protein
MLGTKSIYGYSLYRKLNSELLFCYIMARTSHISLDGDDVRFVLD